MADGTGGEADARRRLEELRERISAVDEELIRLIGERRNLVLEVARVKERLGLPVMDPGREAAVVRKAAERARELGVDQEMTRDVVWRIMAAARQVQEERDGLPPSPAEGPGPDEREGGRAGSTDAAAEEETEDPA